MKLYAVFFLTYLKPLILSTIRSYYRNYTDTGSVVSLCSGLKAIMKAEHSMLKLKPMWCTARFCPWPTSVFDTHQ